MRSAIGNTLRDLFGVWRETRLIVLVAQTAAIYAAVLIPFKVGIPLIPGFAELRPANALPIVASLLFGPAAAWGAGLGNLIGDCFGTLSPASLFGFAGNFLYGYVPYLLWGRLGPLSSGRDPVLRSWRQWLEFVLVCAVASIVCAAVIGWGADLLKLVPFWVLTIAIFFNNLVMALLLAPPLLLFLGPRVKRWGLRYQDIQTTTGQEARGEGLEEEPGAAALTSDPQAPFVDVRSVSFTYQGSDVPALRDLSLSITRGESMALMGRTGGGKTTFCHALNGLIPQKVPGHWDGRILVDGYDTARRPVWSQANTVGVLFQDFETQLISTNLLMEMAFPLEHASDSKGLSREQMWGRIRDTLARVGLSGMETRDPLTLSGGQRQRLVLATILARRPDLLVLDEPFTDLDPDGRRTLTTVLRELRRSGATLLTVEHDPEEVVAADHLAILDQGSLAWSGRPRDLFGQAGGRRRAQELGISFLPLASCFDELDLPALPLTVEDAWEACDRHDLELAPDARSGGAARSPLTPRTDAPPVLEVDHVSFGYVGSELAIHDVSLTIREGEFVAIIGRNGSGKSTLASLLKGLRLPSQGRVRVLGEETERLTAGRLAALVGYVFQNPDHQLFAETVDTEVSFGVRNLGYDRAACDERVTAALKAVGLDAPEIRGLDPFSMTKGDRQRIAVASVLAERPGILIFDEPSTGLDGQETRWMMEMIRRLNERGHTIVMITHAMSLVAAYARRCVVLREGRIDLDGPTRDVFARLVQDDAAASLGLQAPAITRFSARWGQTLLTVEEVKQALRKRS